MEQIVVDNRYALSRPLGGGGMAKVYLAHDEVLDRDVAIKLLREQFADDDEFVERFKREAQSAAALSHPHIVQIYDRGRSGAGDYYIAMEYVPNGTLKERLVRDGALAPGVAAGVAEQIADALSLAHEKGVVHRDIKPQNVLVTRSGDVKVTDFGIARAASATRAVTTTSAILGTAGYMSPEQARGEPVGPTSDLYSLGVVLFEMLTGNLPYEAENPMALAMRHVNEPVRSPREDNPEVPEALDAITKRLLAKDPEDRYPSAATLANDLERIQSGLAPAVVDAEKTRIMAAPLPPLPQRGKGTARTAVTRRPAAAAPPTGYAGERSRRRGGLLPVFIVLFVAVALIAGVAFALTRDFGLPSIDPPAQQQARQVAVPQVTTLAEADAVAALEAEGLQADVQDRDSSFQEEGVVLDQDPAAGGRADEGSTVVLGVGAGPSSVFVPDLAYESDAEAVLFNAGLGLGETTYQESDSVPAGQVISANPAEGTEVETESVVDIVVSTGPPTQQYESAPAPGTPAPGTPAPSTPASSGGDAFQGDAFEEPAQPQEDDGGRGRGRGRGRSGEGEGGGE